MPPEEKHTKLQTMIDNNNPVVVLRGWYDDSYNRVGGHYVIIHDYHWDSTAGLYVYDIYDPWAVNIGSSYYRSYQSICNGRNKAFETDRTDSGLWEGIVVYEKGNYESTMNWPSP